MGVAPRPALLRPAVGFAGVGGPSSILAEGPVAAVPRLSLGATAVCRGGGGSLAVLGEAPVGVILRLSWLWASVG